MPFCSRDHRGVGTISGLMCRPALFRRPTALRQKQHDVDLANALRMRSLPGSAQIGSAAAPWNFQISRFMAQDGRRGAMKMKRRQPALASAAQIRLQRHRADNRNSNGISLHD